MIPKDRVILGTAQLGAAYGVFGQQESSEDALSRLDDALSSGFSAFDTAPAYGASEQLLGQRADQSLSIITKTVSLDTDLNPQEIARNIRDGVSASLTNLKTSTVQAVLLHQPELFDASVAQAMDALKQDGLCLQVGVSVYDGTEIDQILSVWRPDIIQLPLNILDQRLIDSGHIIALQEQSVEIHIRSAFLQGVLLSDPEAIPERIAGLQDPVRLLQEEAEKSHISRQTLCLGYLDAVAPEAKIVVGLQTQEQRRALENALNQARPPTDPARFAISDPALVNPALWPAP